MEKQIIKSKHKNQKWRSLVPKSINFEILAINDENKKIMITLLRKILRRSQKHGFLENIWEN